MGNRATNATRVEKKRRKFALHLLGVIRVRWPLRGRICYIPPPRDAGAFVESPDKSLYRRETWFPPCRWPPKDLTRCMDIVVSIAAPKPLAGRRGKHSVGAHVFKRGLYTLGPGYPTDMGDGKGDAQVNDGGFLLRHDKRSAPNSTPAARYGRTREIRTSRCCTSESTSARNGDWGLKFRIFGGLSASIEKPALRAEDTYVEGDVGSFTSTTRLLPSYGVGDIRMRPRAPPNAYKYPGHCRPEKGASRKFRIGISRDLLRGPKVSTQPPDRRMALVSRIKGATPSSSPKSSFCNLYWPMRAQCLFEAMRKSEMGGFYSPKKLFPTTARPEFAKYGPTAYGRSCLSRPLPIDAR